MDIDPRRSAIRSHAYEMYREILSESEPAIRTFYRLKRHRAYHECNDPIAAIRPKEWFSSRSRRFTNESAEHGRAESAIRRNLSFASCDRRLAAREEHIESTRSGAHSE